MSGPDTTPVARPRRGAPWGRIAFGVGCLVAAQAIATSWVAPQRQAMTPLQDIYQTLTPGEFAGTLMLGGFRGLASDLLWMRADLAKENGRFYESTALFQTISRIQPRFEMPWSYMAWDLAYNLSHEVNDPDSKWAWIKAGIEVNRQGLERNPHSERLLRHLAWIFHHKGDLFHEQVERDDWATMVNGVLKEVNRICREKDPTLTSDAVELLPVGPGLRNFTISSRLYMGCTALADHKVIPRIAMFVRRLVPLGLESDGNILRNRGDHKGATLRYLDALDRWAAVRRVSEAEHEQNGSAITLDQNEGRLRRKAAQFVRTLAKDPAEGDRVAQAILDRRIAEARTALEGDGFRKVAVESLHIRWLDEGG